MLNLIKTIGQCIWTSQCTVRHKKYSKITALQNYYNLDANDEINYPDYVEGT